MTYHQRQIYEDRERRKRHQEHDVEVRALVGARLKREIAVKVRQAAAREGISVYRWVSNAIEQALQS